MAFYRFCLFATGILWGAWPLMMRSLGSSRLINFLLSASAAVVLGLLAIGAKNPMPPVSTLWRIGVSGVMMAVGLASFTYVATHPKAEMSTALPIIDAVMILVGVIGGVWLFSEAMTVRKALGVALLLLGIWLLHS